MSEYQCYEFVALDLPLTGKQMAELRALSTRAEISPTRFWNEYQWGDLKADPARLMARYFDAHLYFANWGTHRLMLRIPKARLDPKALEPYFVGRHAARLTSTGEHVLIDLGSDTEEPEYDEQSQGSLAALSPLRAELMRGDLRPAYLAWLLAVSADDLDDDAEEPSVPAGLAELSAAQEAMVEFLRIDVDLVSAAKRASAAVAKDDASFRRWLAALPSREKDAWLGRAADDPELGLGGELLRAFRTTTKAEHHGTRRTVRELRTLAEAQRAQRQKAEAERARKTKAQADAARQRHLTRLARDVEGAWSKLEKLVEASDYDVAVKLAIDLRDLATREATAPDLRSALRGAAQAPTTSPGILRPVEARKRERFERPVKTMAARKSRTDLEWVGGIVAMPAYVTGEGEPYRPETLFWMSAEGAVLGHTVGRPGELVELACASLRSTIEQPMFGRPHAPDRVRVASPELAEALRAGQPDLEVVCGPTPEIDAVFAAMRARMNDDAETEQSYLSPDVGPAAVAAFFRAAAALFRAKPWKTVPSDQSLFAVSIEKLGVTDAALSVIGQMGQSLGLILFSSIEGFEAYLEAADAMEHGEEPTMPPHFALNFERGAELSAALRKEIAEHHWEVASVDAYPWLVAVDEDLVARPPTAEEVTIAEAIALALPKVLEEKKALLAAWNGGDPVAHTLVVATHAGDVEVSLRVPYEREPGKDRPPYDVLADLFELGQDGDEIDAEARRPLEDELVRRFVASPEAKALTDVQSCHFVMNFAADYFNATIATLGPRELREIVFDIIPRKVSIDASVASWIIEENRAFYAFLKREFGLEQADACLRVLGGDAVKKLEAALSDRSKFGMAKSLFMGGREAGFDMDSKEGIETWMRLMQSQPLPASVRLPSLGSPARPQDKTAARAKKNARKAARKARKKNR